MSSAVLRSICEDILKFAKNGDPVKDVIENTSYTEEELLVELAKYYIRTQRK